ncbi:Rpn family recombination-promoting nuclease/putative transposase [Clostridium estertheticum]|uniref:Rpn family recombination-promoting nuclease/putative transposase n=1 Tax=Clostridium estertheticum TaxID=238834 RepID=UPI0027148230|nr:Rpn family recombination-promoting nuclease/putative transposase [Clostridium estertheticum]
MTLEIVENKELTPELVGDKTGIIDVRAKTEDGTQLEIEVQLTNQHNMDKRTMWYWGEMFSEGIKKGDDYKNLTKVITINIVDFEYIKIPDKFHTTFHLWEDGDKDYMLTDVVEIHFIEMAKFRKLKNKNLKEDKLQRWLSFLSEDISEKELRELTDMDVDIRKAEEKIEYLSSDPKTLELYKARERSLHERANMISSAVDETATQIAKNLLNMGLSVEEVAKGSELPIAKVQILKKEMLN